MTSIDSLLKSKTVNSSVYVKFKKNLKTALCGAIQKQKKTKVLVLVSFDSVIVLLVEVISISWISAIHM